MKTRDETNSCTHSMRARDAQYSRSHIDISKYSIFSFGHIGLVLEADNNSFISALNGT